MRRLGVWLVFLAACSTQPDPHSIEGTLAYAAQALEEDDGRRLFKVIDVRSRHALSSIVADRRRARALVESRYPEAERVRALATLGDAAQAADAEALFASRCTDPCRRAIRDALGAPTATRVEDGVTVVETTRGAELRLFRRNESEWWGIVYETEALVAERDRANRDLDVVRENATTYDRARSLRAP